MAEENPWAKKYGVDTGQQASQQPTPNIIVSPPRAANPLQVNADRRAEENSRRAEEAQARAIEKDNRDYQFRVEKEQYQRAQDERKAAEGSNKSPTQLDLEAKAESAQKRKITVDGLTSEVRRLYDQDIKGQPASRAFGLTEYIGFLPKNDRFSAAGNAILPLVRPLVAQSAKEGDSDKEMMVFMSYIPQADDADITIEQKLKMLDILIGGMVEGKTPSETLSSLGEQGVSGGIRINGQSNQDASIPYEQSEPTQTVAANGFERMDMKQAENDDEYYFQRAYGYSSDKNNAFTNWLNQNNRRSISPDQIDAKKRELGIPLDSDYLESSDILARDSRRLADYNNKNNRNEKWAAGDPYAEARKKAIGVRREEMQEEGSDNPISAAAYGAADSVSLGFADELGSLLGDEAGARDYRLQGDVYNQDNPIARTVGGVAGALALPFKGGGLGKAARAAGESPTAIRGAVAADASLSARQGAGYGAAYGAGSGENAQQRVGNALVGGALGAAGGAVGERLMQSAPALKLGNALSTPRSKPSALSREQADVVQAGEFYGVPIRQADVNPKVRQTRANALSGEKGNVIREAERADIAALEQAVARNVGGDGAPLDAISMGDLSQNIAKRGSDNRRIEAGNFYDKARSAAPDAKIEPIKAIEAIDEQIAELTENGLNANKGAISYLKGVRQDLSKKGGLSINSLRSQRTSVRGQIKERNLDYTDLERRMGIILDAASDDVADQLPPIPQELFMRGDAIWRERASFNRQIRDQILGKNRDNPLSPADAAARVNTFIKKDPKRFSQFIDEATPEEKIEIAATIGASFGRKRNGEFSPADFITHTSGKGALVSPAAAYKLFGKRGVEAIRDLREIAKAKVGANEATNYSKTGGVVKDSMGNLRNVMLGGLGFTQGGVVGGLVLPMGVKIMQRMGEERTVRMLLNPDFTKLLKVTPKTRDPKVINAYFNKMNEIAAKGSVLSSDIKALQSAIRSAYSEDDKKEETNSFSVSR